MREFEEAIEDYQEMLDLNPNDNQNVRYLLLSALLERGTDREVGTLLKRYDADLSATWAYSRALWQFRKDGDSRRANATLRDAITVNDAVPGYLLGEESTPRELPPDIGAGTEAVVYF